jgi:hypothetical protein
MARLFLILINYYQKRVKDYSLRASNFIRVKVLSKMAEVLQVGPIFTARFSPSRIRSSSEWAGASEFETLPGPPGG